MEQNLAAWMINGGPREDPHAARDRAQLHDLLESRRAARAGQPGLISRIRQIVQPTAAACPDPATCPA